MAQPQSPSNPASTAPQNAPSGGQPATVPPAGTNSVSAPTLSGTWSQEEYPQILIQWALSPPGSSNPDYMAQVGVYQLIFDTEIPSPLVQSPIVPFSLLDPYGGPVPLLQGSLVLTQNPPTLEVMNLQFPGFKAQSLTLFPLPLTVPEGGGSSTPAGPAAGGGAPAPGGGTPAGGSTGAA